ncbi:MAG TPA: hypothetical protein VMU60_04745 [Syntrophobacteria bacterium]|jgi:hypothetical protein|nr:hypothetical protein [Syntrophobacteria bacterium]
MKKFSLVSAIILLALIVVIAVGLFNLGPIVAKALNVYGPRLTKTEVRVSNVDISLLSGTATLSDFILGSPKGFTSPETVKARSIYLDVDERSLLGDTVVIDRIEVFRPEIFYEKRDGTDNLKAILDAMKSGQKKSEPSSSSKAPGKRLLIKDLILREGTLNVVVSGTGGKNVRVSLSELHLRNVSEETAGGVTAEAFAAVLDAIYKQVASPGLLGTLNRDLKTIGAKTDSAVEKIKGLFEK